MAIFDEGVQRPNTTSIFGPLEDSITFGGSGSVLYGYDNESSGFGFSRMTVSPDGVTINDSQQVFQGFGQRIVYQLGRVYGSFGQIIDPTVPGLVGTLPSAGPLIAVDAVRSRVYSLSNPSSGTSILRIYNTDTFTQIAAFQVTSVGGQPRSLIRWGSDGLAFKTDSDQIYILRFAGDDVPVKANITSPANGASCQALP